MVLAGKNTNNVEIRIQGYIIFQRLKWDFSTLGKGWGGSFLIFTFFIAWWLSSWI
jgi:hypothetical protein